MRRWLAFAVLTALLQGCATRLDIQTASGRDGGDGATGRPVLTFQDSSIVHKSDGALLAPEDLRPGDILLASGPGLVSAGVQLVTLSPVSHAALYVGNGKVVEAVRPKVRVWQLDEFLAEGTVALAFRYPGLDEEQARNISHYALRKAGTGFNFLGVTLHVPFSVARRACELPLVPSPARDACIRSFGLMNHLAASKRRLFCSQLVLQAYRQAGVPITDADPRLISPADLLHMREGDVSSVRVHKRLRYVGHLKHWPTTLVALDQ